MTDQSVVSQLTLAAKSARDFAEQTLGMPLQFRLEWSNRLTSSAGVAMKPAEGRPIVRLSSPIFLKHAEEHGAAAACEEVRKTTLHEIAHVVAGDGHGPKWRSTMWALGVDPGANRYHHMACGVTLSGTVAVTTAAQYPVGTWVEFQARGRTLVGEIKRHSAKTLSITQESELIDGMWEDTTMRRWWRIPWRLVDDTIMAVVD